MKFFIDPASLNEIRQAGETVLIDGVTTNPFLTREFQTAFLHAFFSVYLTF